MFIDGADLLEVRAPGVTRAEPALLIQQQAGPGAAILAFGDGPADEELFGVLGDDSTTIHVGAGQTIARYRVPGPHDVRALLTALL